MLNLKIFENNLRRTARYLLGKRKFDKIKYDIYNELLWFLPYDSYLYKSLCFMYKVVQDTCAPYFKNLIQPNCEIHTHETRNKNNIYIANTKPNMYGQRSFQYVICNEWNKLPAVIIESQSFNKFKLLLKIHLLEAGKTASK